MDNSLSGKTRIYIDGGFDMAHSGHYNAMRQAKALGDVLVAGVISDEELVKTKGPTIMNLKERTEVARHCKFIDQVAPGVPYSPTIPLIKSLNCSFYAHGDDLALNSDGEDPTQVFVKAGMFKVFKRTEGVSTTCITGKLLEIAEDRFKNERNK